MSGRDIWDPHFGTRPFRSEPVAKPSAGIAIPAWLKSAVGTFLLVAFAGLAVGLMLSQTLLFVSIPAIVVAFAALIAMDKLGKVQDRLRWFYFQLAERNGWDFAYYQPNQLGRRAARSVGMEDITVDPNAETDPDPRIVWVFKRIPELLRPGRGSWTPFQMQAGYWGDLRGGTPFWMGLASLEVNATLGTKAKRTDDNGTEGSKGSLFRIALAYPLPRDSGLRMTVLPRSMIDVTATHLETESTVFNDTFSVDLDHAIASYEEGRREALRLLTPATQTTLLDLHERFGTTMVVDADVVFFAGEAQVNIRPVDAAAGELNSIIHAFGDAALAMRTYLD